jgi:hypothetical protein
MHPNLRRVFACKHLSLSASVAIVAAAMGSLAATSSAAVTVNGTYSSDFGISLTTQTINTGYGDSSYSGAFNGFKTDADGSELDAAYGVIENGYLYLLISGDMQNNGNRLNIFIADGRTGQFTLNAGSNSTLSAMNGSKFSPNFGHGATYALEVNINNGDNCYLNYYNLFAGPNVNGYAGSFLMNGSTNLSPNTQTGGFIEAFNDSNVSTMTDAGAAASQTNANAVQTGFEIAIPLTSLGNPTGPIEVLVDINSGKPVDGYLSNQFLPGLPAGTGNLAKSTFDFSTTPGMFFTVPPQRPAHP